MELDSRLKTLSNALDRMEEALDIFTKTPCEDKLYDLVRDSVIQRFEFSVDIFWKCLKDYLFESYKIKTASPKTVLDESLNLKIITIEEFSILVNMIDDRNDSSHRYDESMAEDIAKKAGNYHSLMVEICEKLKI